jgi:membrane-associated phospholipid phosphatase
MVIAHQPRTPEFYWAVAADSLLVVWTAALLLAPRWGGSAIGARRFRIVGLATALAVSLVALAGKTLEVWPGNDLFPSGHTGYAVAIAVFLVGRDRRWLPWVVPALALTALSLVLSNFHVAVDVVGGALAALAIAIPVFLRLRRAEAGRASSEAEGQRAPRTAATSSSTEGRSSGPELR